jgi:hypothetical protein
MDWVALGAIAQIVAAFAVVISLVYLARQIRDQNRESRLASIHELNESFRAAILSFQNPHLADIFSRAKTDFESLTETERLQFISMVQGIFRVWEDAYHQHHQKRLDNRLWEAMVVQFSGYLSLPGVIRVWEIRKQAYSEDFRFFFERSAPRDYLTK